METATVAQKKLSVLKGGEFLIKESSTETLYTPEMKSEEQKMFAQMASEFIVKEVRPHVMRIDKGDHDLVVDLLEQAGELGILGASLPEKYGGMGVNFNTDSYLSEEIGKSNSWGVAVAAHTGIGTLPILYYGNEEQKEKYLPGLASGKLKAAYCLTEPGSGSDALAAKTKATLMDDGEHYLIEGQKMWITNSGFADLFIVFAQVDGNQFTGFVVDAKSENIELGAEEDKMGIKGSSTRQVFFQGVKVPKENVLGEVGKGHYIAFNVLNIGRYKLCAMVLGGSKACIDVAVKYANEREQFKQAIANFGAIKHKLAEMAIRTWVCESATYRTSGLINDMIEELKAGGMDSAQAKLEAAEEYSVECAMLKVLGSEVLDYVVDETVQIHGGNGFSEEYPAARAYRDARINRIFEGTSEINRLLSVGMMLKKAMKGQLDLFTPAKAIQKELMSVPSFGKNGSGGEFAVEWETIKNLKKAILMVAGAMAQKYMAEIEKEQELMMLVSDMMIDLYAAESALLRTQKLVETKGKESTDLYVDIMQTFLSDACERIFLNGKHAVVAFGEGDELKGMLMGLKRFTKYQNINTIALRRKISDKMVANNNYSL